MNIKEMNRHEIEKKLEGMGEYVQMDYLQRALKSNIDFDTKKFVQIRLAKIYESRNMFLESAKLIKNSAEINTTFKGKIEDYMKSVELFIRAGSFEEADEVFKRALACGNVNEKNEIKKNLKTHYFNQALHYLKQDKRNQAKKTYERILTLELSKDEKNDVQDKLLNLYNKLGFVREYRTLNNSR
ncbi:hypothetical protein AUJ84_03330 [Candidatus Pacearchaeota archaeon CG1_02_32_132]|nr:MAG: hypothetical protein AUJ84_03330 [Candidatus Pacearchaeota archaeon CG1_02_32_132]